jgi:hypothetical protein
LKLQIEVPTMEFGHPPIGKLQGEEVPIISVVFADLARADEADFVGGTRQGAVDF